MGSPKRLKIKDDLNYRKGSTAHYCSHCNNYTEVEIFGCGGNPLGKQPRCKLIGVDKNSRRYRINPNHICDRYDNSEHLNRLGRM